MQTPGAEAHPMSDINLQALKLSPHNSCMHSTSSDMVVLRLHSSADFLSTVVNGMPPFVTSHAPPVRSLPGREREQDLPPPV